LHQLNSDESIRSTVCPPLDNDGALSGNFTPTGSNFNDLTGPAIDSSGNAWMPNYRGTTVTELVGMAAPAKIPFIGAPQLP
jgi:hypothetical protein